MTLAELMIAISIVAILVLVAYPSFNRTKMESRRESAHASLLNAESMIESYLAQNNLALFGSTDLATAQFANYDSSSSTPVLSQSSLYKITITPDSSGYTITAIALDNSAVPCGSSSDPTTGQCTDNLCWNIYLDHGAHKSSDNTGAIADASSTKCW